jgi:hypothetical protein
MGQAVDGLMGWGKGLAVRSIGFSTAEQAPRGGLGNGLG